MLPHCTEGGPCSPAVFRRTSFGWACRLASQSAVTRWATHEPMLNTEIMDQTRSGTPPASSTKQFVTLAFAIIAMIILFDVISWINGGGVLSIGGACLKIYRKSDSINIDKHCLMTPACIFICVATCALSRLTHRNISDHDGPRAVVVIVLISAFAFDWTLSPKMIDLFMESQHYKRCSSLDHVVGLGKGRVDFAEYVARQSLCP